MKTFTFILVLSVCAFAQDKIANSPAPQSKTEDKARVFITDSQSWEMSGGGGGSSAGFGGASSGGARPQTAEIVKTFGERCPDVVTNNKQEKADYIVVLDHEGGKGWLKHKNKVAVFNRVSGDSVVSKSTLSLGGSVQEACEAIRKDWPAHASGIRAASAKAAKALSSVIQPPELAKSASGAKLSIISSPDGADIDVDGSFVGSTPSSIELTAGDHMISVSKNGYKAWSKKIKVTSGDVRLNAELEKGTSDK
jgi:hypothetical protein